MPLLTILGLVLSAVKLAMELTAWVKAHPDAVAGLKETFERAHYTLEQVHDEVAQTIAERDQVESP